MRRGQSAVELHQPFQKPFEVAAAFALLAWFAGPWLMTFLAPWMGAAAVRWASLMPR
jgi:hypothetical protein